MKTPHFPLSSINLLAIRWQNLHRYCPRFFFLPPRKLSARIGLYDRLIYLVFRQLGPCCRCLSESTCISNERRGRNVANWRRVVECVNQGQCCYRISLTLRPSFVSFTRSFVDLDFDVVVVDVDRQLRLGGATHTDVRGRYRQRRRQTRRNNNNKEKRKRKMGGRKESTPSGDAGQLDVKRRSPRSIRLASRLPGALQPNPPPFEPFHQDALQIPLLTGTLTSCGERRCK